MERFKQMNSSSLFVHRRDFTIHLGTKLLPIKISSISSFLLLFGSYPSIFFPKHFFRFLSSFILKICPFQLILLQWSVNIT
jgi:hypothetical protein